MQQAINQPHHLLTDDQQAIVALCTPRGSGAIGLIRISGINAIAVADALAQLSSGSSLSKALSHTIHHGHVIDQRIMSNQPGRIVDEVLFLLMKGPKTFTGQDTIEITCHNNPYIIEQIINLAIQHGARSARAGEFTKRAFLQGKVDLVQAESINELIGAQTERALRQSLAQLRGSLSESFLELQKEVVSLLGYVEASFEFLDEEQRDLDFDYAIRQRTADILDKVRALKAHFSQQKQIKEGIRVAILGLVNAGKSTLFNALLKQERAIVTPIAGTTRDSIETGLYRKGNFLLFIDTAGIRDTQDVIEQKGIQRSFNEALAADIILLVFDAARDLTPEQQQQYDDLITLHGNKIIIVINKVDEVHDDPLGQGSRLRSLSSPESHASDDIKTVLVSAKNQTGIDSLEQAIEDKTQQLFAQNSSPFLLNQRQFKLLTEIETYLEFIANSYSGGIHYELVAYQLKDLLEKISELTGKNVTEQVLDMVFSEFCVGK